MNTQTAITAAIVIASLALQVGGIVYWIGPAGCVILVPALVMVLLLPLLDVPGGIRIRQARGNADRSGTATPIRVPALLSDEHSVEPELLPNGNSRQDLQLPSFAQGFRSWLDASWPSRPAANRALLDQAEKIKITEKIQPNGTRERSVMIVYRKTSR